MASQSNISKRGSSFHLFTGTPSKGILYRGICIHLSKEILCKWRTLSKETPSASPKGTSKWEADFCFPKEGPSKTLKGTPLRASLYPDAHPPTPHHSPSPPGFLISKCCFPVIKAKTGKAKRVRTIFTSDQLARLEKEFARQQYMVGMERCLLASALHLTEEQVSPTMFHVHLPPPAGPGRLQSCVPMGGTWVMSLRQ